MARASRSKGRRPSTAWHAAAVHIAELVESPLMAFDADERVVMVNPAMDALLGWRRHELLGKRYAELCCPSRPPGLHLTDALAGRIRESSCSVTTRDGRRLSLRMTWIPAVNERERYLIGLVQSVNGASESKELAGVGDLHYQIGSSVTDFGMMRRIVEGPTQARLGNRRCFRLLHGRDRPCEDCPVIVDPEKPWPRSHVTRIPGDRPAYRLTVARPVGRDTIDVKVQNISESLLADILQAKVDALAKRADLSEREHAVLRLLLSGRSSKELGELLGISLRTVKFHQGNLLQKLGADSRADLMRLIF